jgi:hypothetical protein
MGRHSDLADRSVTGPIERCEHFGRAVATGYVDHFIGGERSSRREFLTVPLKPDFRLSVVDHAGATVYVLIHGVSLPLYVPFQDLVAAIVAPMPDLPISPSVAQSPAIRTQMRHS